MGRKLRRRKHEREIGFEDQGHHQVCKHSQGTYPLKVMILRNNLPQFKEAGPFTRKRQANMQTGDDRFPGMAILIFALVLSLPGALSGPARTALLGPTSCSSTPTTWAMATSAVMGLPP